VPLTVLNIYQVFGEEDEAGLHQFLSEVATDYLKEKLTIFTAFEDLWQRAYLAGCGGGNYKTCLEFLMEFVEKELLKLLPTFDSEKLQAVHFIEPSTIVITIFVTEKDPLYAKLYPRT